MPLPTKSKAAVARIPPSRYAAPFAPLRRGSASLNGSRRRGDAAVGEIVAEGLAPGTRRVAGEALVKRRVEDRPVGTPRRPRELRRRDRARQDVGAPLARED